MKNVLLIIVMTILMGACSNQSPKKEARTPVNEVVDVRIYAKGDIRFNGKMIDESSLTGHIKSLHISDWTRARIIADENAYTGVVNKTRFLLFDKGIRNINFKIVSSKTLEEYDSQKAYIDVLSSGRILFNGDKLYPEDLEISLQNTYLKPSAEFIVSVSPKAQVGPVFDVLEELSTKGIGHISFEDPSSFHHW